MSKHERPTESDDQNLPAADQIKKFNAENKELRNLGGFGEEMANCGRLIETLVLTDSLTTETLGAVFARAHENIPASATYLLAYRAFETAAKTGKLNGEIFSAIEQSVMADTDPVWSMLGKQEEQNKRIMFQLLTNEHLFELMLPFISPEQE